MDTDNRFQSPSIGALAAALAKAQATMPSAPKTKSATVFKGGGGYSYADLATCLQAALPTLAANGLCVIQTIEPGERGQVLRTTLAHASGEWVASEQPLVPAQNTPQGMGSAITYARRYALMAIVGMAADDDDGAEASHPTRQASAAEQAFAQPAANHNTLPARAVKRGRGRPPKAALTVAPSAIICDTSPEHERAFNAIEAASTHEQLDSCAPLIAAIEDPEEHARVVTYARKVRAEIRSYEQQGQNARDALVSRIQGDKPA